MKSVANWESVALNTVGVKNLLKDKMLDINDINVKEDGSITDLHGYEYKGYRTISVEEYENKFYNITKEIELDDDSTCCSVCFQMLEHGDIVYVDSIDDIICKECD